jgi:hypothetical protein
MSNSIKGEVTIKRGTDKKELTMVLGVNQLIYLEEQLDSNVNSIVAQLSNSDSIKVGLLRKIFFASLVKHQPDMTEDDAGDIMQEIGLDQAMTKITETIQAAFPKVPANPQKPQQRKGGNGGNS